MEQVTVSSIVAAPPEVVWKRIGSAEGVAHEFSPWLKMTMPRHLKGMTLDDVPLGVPLGRAWLLLFGVIPFDYDDMVLAERETGRRFLESSTMLTMSRWQHERVVEPHARGATITDTLRFEPRVAKRTRLMRKVMGAIVGALFRHRHRRLGGYLGR